MSKTERTEVKMENALVVRIDEWRRRQGAIPSRGEAIRYLIKRSLDIDNVAGQPRHNAAATDVIDFEWELCD